MSRSGFWRCLRADASGGIAMIGAAGLPVLLVLGVGAIELQQVLTDRGRTQDVADAAALQGAQQLGVTPNGATNRTQAFALAQLTDISARSTVTITATSPSNGVMKVSIDTQRMSFFANLLPPGGFHTHAEATALGESMAPLCVLTIGTSNTVDDLGLTGTSKLQAPACMSHADHNITVTGNAALAASVSEAVGTATGSITPAANAGAAAIADPFANVPLTPPSSCNVEATSITSGILALQPGLHCQALSIQQTGTLQLAAGAHYFKGNLHLQDSAQLDGTAGAALVFMGSAQFQADPATSASLKGAKSGPLAGFVIATTRDYTSQFSLPSSNITQLTGTVYVPSAQLYVSGASKSGQSTPWTVVVAKGLSLDGSTNLLINANYAATDVPVPTGVGNKAGATRLTH